MKKSFSGLAVLVLSMTGGLCSQVQAESGSNFVPGVYFSYAFVSGHAASELHYGAQLSMTGTLADRWRDARNSSTSLLLRPAGNAESALQYMQLDFQPGTKSSLKLLGSEVAGYQYRLDESDSGNSPGWFARNWWWVTGLGAVIVGGAVLGASGGGSSSSNPHSTVGAQGVGCTGTSCVVPCNSTGPVNTCG